MRTKSIILVVFLQLFRCPHVREILFDKANLFICEGESCLPTGSDFFGKRNYAEIRYLMELEFPNLIGELIPILKPVTSKIASVTSKSFAFTVSYLCNLIPSGKFLHIPQFDREKYLITSKRKTNVVAEFTLPCVASNSDSLCLDFTVDFINRLNRQPVLEHTFNFRTALDLSLKHTNAKLSCDYSTENCLIHANTETFHNNKYKSMCVSETCTRLAKQQINKIIYDNLYIYDAYGDQILFRN